MVKILLICNTLKLTLIRNLLTNFEHVAMRKAIRLGTRGSPLALIQAETVRKKIIESTPNIIQEYEIEIVPIRTSGDWRPEHKERSFNELGGNKGLFTKEIEEALLENHIDFAVHSMKDIASKLPEALEIAAILERMDPRDAFISPKARTLEELPSGSIVGTSSLRRQSQILARRPDLNIVPLRGNIDTRLAKLTQGIADATLLAVAGLTRLKAQDRWSSIMDTDMMLPAAAQGAIGIEIRRDDYVINKLIAPLKSSKTMICISAERAMLKFLDGSCHTPIAALAKLNDYNIVTLEGLVARPDGTSLWRFMHSGPSENAEEVGIELGQRFKSVVPSNIFSL